MIDMYFNNSVSTSFNNKVFLFTIERLRSYVVIQL